MKKSVFSTGRVCNTISYLFYANISCLLTHPYLESFIFSFSIIAFIILLFSYKTCTFLGYSFMHCVQRTYRALIITISCRAVTIGTPRHTPDPPTATYAAKLFLVKLLFKFKITKFEFPA